MKFKTQEQLLKEDYIRECKKQGYKPTEEQIKDFLNEWVIYEEIRLNKLQKEINKILKEVLK